METPEASDLKAYPTCKICDRGTLMPRKIRRLSGPAVAIAYILLIPSILGMAACAILLIVSLLAGVAGAAHGSAFATAFAGIGAIAFVYIGILSFVFGLVGWLLIMKKHILQCVYCGAVVDAAAAVYSHPNRSFGRARVFGIFFLFLIFIAMAVGLFHNDYRTWASGGHSLFDWTEFAARWHIHMATEPAQPAPDNSTAEPTQPDAWQPFTFADGRFSVLFPGTPQQSSQTIHVESGERTIAYRFTSADNGTSYFVTYADYRPDVVGPSPQVFLQGNENFAVNGKRLLTDAAINLDGVPGRAFTFTGSYADGSSRSCNVHEFLAGTRLYTLTVLSPPIPLKGDTATQADQFVNSFRIWGNPPTTVDNSTAPSETPKSALSFQPSPESTHVTPAPASRSGWKTYEAANCEKFRVNMATLRYTQLGVEVWGGIHGVDVIAHPMIFDCRGHYFTFIDNDVTGSTATGWMLAPSRSVIGAVAKDVCPNKFQPAQPRQPAAGGAP